MAQESSHASVGKTVGKSKTLSAFVCDLDLRWKPTTTFFFFLRSERPVPRVIRGSKSLLSNIHPFIASLISNAQLRSFRPPCCELTADKRAQIKTHRRECRPSRHAAAIKTLLSLS